MAAPNIKYTDTVAMNGAKVLVYGAPDAGKTTLLATAPTPFIMSAEKGLLSLRRVRVPYAEITSYANFADLWAWIKTSKEARKFQTFGIDSVTEIAQVCIADLLAGTNGVTKIKHGEAAYGEMQTNIAAILREMRNFDGPNFVFNFKQAWQEDKATGTTFYTPTVPGRLLVQDLAYLFDEVFWMHKFTGADGKQWRGLQTQADFRATAKDRSGMLDTIERPDLTYVFNKMMGK